MVSQSPRRLLGLSLGFFPHTSLTTLCKRPLLPQNAWGFLVLWCTTQLCRTHLSERDGTTTSHTLPFRATRVYCYLLARNEPAGWLSRQCITSTRDSCR